MNKHDQIVKALKKLVPNASYGVRGEEIEWGDKDVSQPSQSDLETAMAEVLEEEEKTQYRIDREKSYDPIPAQLDYIFHHGLEKWKSDVVQPVKDKFPKPV
tara:strand:+ start:1946 stop:2248 length:303 start_codon:yes stop_codon:yes gene_type:complete